MTLKTTFDFGFSLLRDNKLSFHHFKHTTHCDMKVLQAGLTRFFTRLNTPPFDPSVPRITSYSIKPIMIKKCEDGEKESPLHVLVEVLKKVALAIPAIDLK